jgi:hypothetical protein
MTPEMFDETIGEDKVELFSLEQLIRLQSIAYHRSYDGGPKISPIEVDDSDMARNNRCFIPPVGGPA